MTVRALSKIKWFPDMSIYEAKLVTGASELMEPVKDGKLSVALGKPMQWHWHARN